MPWSAACSQVMQADALADGHDADLAPLPCIVYYF
jgi:hypothetical protein